MDQVLQMPPFPFTLDSWVTGGKKARQFIEQRITEYSELEPRMIKVQLLALHRTDSANSSIIPARKQKKAQ